MSTLFATFQTSFRGVVVLTCASHAQGPQVVPGWKQISFSFHFIVTQNWSNNVKTVNVNNIFAIYESKLLSMSCCNLFLNFSRFPSSLSNIDAFVASQTSTCE